MVVRTAAPIDPEPDDGEVFRFPTRRAGLLEICLDIPIGFARKWALADVEQLGSDLDALYEVMEGLGIPAAQLDKVGVLELQRAFLGFQQAMKARAGVSLPESSSSPDSPASTPTPSPTTGEPASAAPSS